MGWSSSCGGLARWFAERVNDDHFRAKVEDVYTAQPCTSCGGKGFPLPNLAVPCQRCSGLSFIALPAIDPLKTLVE